MAKTWRSFTWLYEESGLYLLSSHSYTHIYVYKRLCVCALQYKLLQVAAVIQWHFRKHFSLLLIYLRPLCIFLNLYAGYLYRCSASTSVQWSFCCHNGCCKNLVCRMGVCVKRFCMSVYFTVLSTSYMHNHLHAYKHITKYIGIYMSKHH